MKTSPTGFQVTFLLFAITFAAMLVTRAAGRAIGLPEGFFNTLGNLIAFPLETRVRLLHPGVARAGAGGSAPPLPRAARAEAMALSVLKVTLTFGVWGAVALWGLHVTQRSTNLHAYGFLLDREAMDARYFATWGLVNAVLAVTSRTLLRGGDLPGRALPPLGAPVGMDRRALAVRHDVLADPSVQPGPDFRLRPPFTPACTAAPARSGRRSFATRSSTCSSPGRCSATCSR